MSEDDAEFLKLAAQRLGAAYDALLSDIDSEWDDDAIERLILAAPKMYELIQQVADLQNPRNYGAAYNDLVMEQDRLADVAQELLAKIEGGGE